LSDTFPLSSEEEMGQNSLENRVPSFVNKRGKKKDPEASTLQNIIPFLDAKVKSIK
jgi:hypothetical protein